MTMKHIYTLLCASAITLTSHAQTTALDFTAADCDGVEQHLFSDLEAGYCVIIDLVMMGCQPCVTATDAFINDIIPYTTDPSMVKLYSIGYTNSTTCAQMNTWKGANGYEHEVFAGMSAQTAHYGGMGMPTIAILGGDQHTVYYSEQGYSANQNTELIAAINGALSGGTDIADNEQTEIGLSPNPATDHINIASGNWQSAQIMDLQGRVKQKVEVTGSRIDISSLTPGLYVVVLESSDGTMGTARFEKR
jgi:hypothetical protein